MNMTCKSTQAKVFDYIYDKLDKDNTVDFIRHIRECDECREELLEYYSLVTAGQQIDRDEDILPDYSESLDVKMKEYIVACRQDAVERVAKRIVLFLIVSAICAIFMLA